MSSRNQFTLLYHEKGEGRGEKYPTTFEIIYEIWDNERDLFS